MESTREGEPLKKRLRKEKKDSISMHSTWLWAQRGSDTYLDGKEQGRESSEGGVTRPEDRPCCEAAAAAQESGQEFQALLEEGDELQRGSRKADGREEREL